MGTTPHTMGKVKPFKSVPVCVLVYVCILCVPKCTSVCLCLYECVNRSVCCVLVCECVHV